MLKDERMGQCYETHPPLKIGKYLVYGGSASSPVVMDADIYLSLQDGSKSPYTGQPWDVGRALGVYYPITDCSVPKSPERFKAMIAWLCNQLQEGKKLHIGCIGGHGRTGLVLSSLVATLTKEKNAVEYVRENYCKKVVESSEQVKFLVKYFGVKEVKGSKSDWHKEGVVSRYHDSTPSSWGYNEPQRVSKAIPYKHPTRDSSIFGGVKIPVYSGAVPTFRSVVGATQMSPVKGSPMSLWKVQ
jgi:hypothetical protein